MQILIGLLIGIGAGFIASVLALHYSGILKAPRPIVVLGGRSNFTVTESEETTAEDIERELEEVKRNLPHYERSVDVDGTGLSPIAYVLKQTALNTPSADEIERFERERTKYLEQYKEYLEVREVFKYAKTSRMLILDIGIKNKHNNVEGVTADIHLPSNVKTLTEEQFDFQLEEPRKPTQPKTTRELLNQGLNFPGLSFNPLEIPMPEPHRNVSPFKITESDSCDVQFEVDFIEHHQTEQCGLLSVVFASFDDIPKKYKITWKLKATNVPKKFRKGRIAIKPVKVKRAR